MDPTSESDIAAVWIIIIFVPFSVVMAASLIFIILPLMGIHIPFNDADKLFLYACYLAIIMPIIYLGWKTVKQR